MSRPRALAVCTTALGDTLLATPALRALSTIYCLDVLVHRRNCALLENNPAIERIYAYRNNGLYRFWLAQTLGRRTYQRLVVMHANFDILRLLPKLDYHRAVNMQGWQDERLRIEILPVSPDQHFIQKRLALAAWAGAEPVDGYMEVHLSAQEMAAGRAWLNRQGQGGGGPWVAFCPGGAMKYKRWPAERFGQAARALNQAGARVLVLGSRREKALVRRVTRAADRPLVWALSMPLRLLAAIVAHSDLVISNDTGPMHLAQAMGAPTLAIIGRGDPKTIGPRRPPYKSLWVEPTCQPCSKACTDPYCLENLQVETVVESAWELLGTRGFRPGGAR